VWGGVRVCVGVSLRSSYACSYVKFPRCTPRCIYVTRWLPLTINTTTCQYLVTEEGGST